MARAVRSIAVAAALVGTLSACGDGADDAADQTTTTGPEATAPLPDNDDEVGDAGDVVGDAEPEGRLELGEVETVAGGLEVPWGLAFVDDDTILVTERPGRVRVIEDGALRPEPIAEIDAVDEGEGGLLGIALRPDLAGERFVYLYYTAEEGNRVVRRPLGDDLTIGDEEVLLDGIPAGRFHSGGRIAFGPDEHLYITTGDATDPDLSADPDSLAGKILRLAPDGSVPDDNPREGSPVWSSGHRNPQGLAWDDDGNLYASEHGPTGEFGGLCCKDELNRIEPGGFYGWPYSSAGIATGQGEPPTEVQEPVAASGADDTWAPAGTAVIADGEGTNVFVANLRAQNLLRFVVSPDDPDDVRSTEVALDGLGRLRAAVVGPDDCLYLTTSNTDGRGQPVTDEDDRVLRACPEAAGGA
jgi:aldose sugar dehydrogenase